MSITPRTRTALAGAGIAVALALGAAAVAAGDEPDEPAIPVEPDGGIGDTPLPVEPDGGIGDTPLPVEPDGGIGDTPSVEFPSDRAREEAHGLLGRYESDLPEDVRIARKGEEWFVLTEDHVNGRFTVELDDEGDGYRVTSVTVELPDGSVTLELTPS